MFKVDEILLSKDVPDIQKWMIVETMMEQFRDLARSVKKGETDVVEQLTELVPKMWAEATVEEWMAEADCYCVYDWEYDGN